MIIPNGQKDVKAEEMKSFRLTGSGRLSAFRGAVDFFFSGRYDRRTYE
jgi:hypothetical protein